MRLRCSRRYSARLCPALQNMFCSVCFGALAALLQTRLFAHRLVQIVHRCVPYGAGAPCMHVVELVV